METHLKVLGVLNIVSGVLGLCGADGDPDAAIALPIIGLTGAALVVSIVAISLPAVTIG